jgi:hypothetical protein
MIWNPRKNPVANNKPYQATVKLPAEKSMGLVFQVKYSTSLIFL